MSNEALNETRKPDALWYEDTIPIRGYRLSLPQIKNAYRELQQLTKSEGDHIVDGLKKPEGDTDEVFAERKAFLKKDAFRVTVSIVGFDGQTVYGETEAIFDLDSLPLPIRTIFFTNSSAFRRNANGNEPRNRFSIWLNFEKPPLFDPNTLVSDRTPNSSNAQINADDIGYFRAVRNIIDSKIKVNRQWYAFLHGKGVYDAGVWFVALPYALYWATIYMDYLFPEGSKYASFRIPFYVYAVGISLVIYRILIGYFKWAFPVNLLEENKDSATKHRVLLGAIVMALVISGAKSLLGKIPLF